MSTEYITEIIGVVGALAGTVLGFFLNFLSDSIRQKQQLKNDLQKAINKAMLVTVVNKYPVVLSALKNIIEEHAHILIKNKGIVEFYSKWLSDPTLALEREFIGMYSNEKINELQNDLSKLKL